MSEVKNYQEVVNIANRHLGKVGGDGYKDTYDPSLLVAIPRKLNREGYGLTGKEFIGYDVWNAYEISAITEKGLPVSGMAKITCPSDTEFHVESKSIKLYLNSFNMTVIGTNTEECIKGMEERISKDLTELLGGTCTAKVFTDLNSEEHSFNDYTDIKDFCDLDNIEFKAYQSDSSQLRENTELKEPKSIKWKSDLLRSNCRVTNQPDWGDVYIWLEGDKIPTAESIAKYIVSHRQVSHFHEEICEMIYTHLKEAFNPDTLMVSCLYTRRGGIDINPVRASHASLIPPFFYRRNLRMKKTLRQ